MTNNHFEAVEKSSAKNSEPTTVSHVVSEALSLLNAPSNKVLDKAVDSLSKTASAFLDLGDALSLYGNGSAEPATGGNRRQQGQHQERHERKERTDKYDRKDKSGDREDNTKDKHERNDKKDTTDNKDKNHKNELKTHSIIDLKSTRSSTTRETPTVAPKPAPVPEYQPRLHPDRQEELSRTQPDEVERLRVSEKTAEHSKLESWADRTLREPELSKFKQDMVKFEERAAKDGLAHADVAMTYREIQRLTNATGETPLTTVERNRLAQQVLHQAAVPTSIDQGSHNTCNITTVESRCYTRTPAQAARLVADVALTGEYRGTHDGTVVKQDPKAHTQSLEWPTPDGARSHASEIFQVTAINLHYAQFNKVHGTNIRYEQVEPKPEDKGDNGERLWNGTTETPDGKGGFVRSPNMSEGQLTMVSNEISARPEQDVTLASAKWFSGTPENVTKIESKEELASKLKYLKEHGQLPIIIRVNTTAEPFYGDSGAGAAGGSGGAHVVTVTDFDEKTNMVQLDNQWGTRNDHGSDKPVHIHDLFTAMQSNEEIEAQLTRDMKWDRGHNTVDPTKEAALLRMQKLNGHISDSDYVKQLNTLVENKHKAWSTGNVSEEQKAKERSELRGLIGNCPAKDQIELLRKEKHYGMIGYEDYRTQLTFAGVKVEKEFNKSSKQSPAFYDFFSADPVKEHNQGTDNFNGALSELTAQDQQWVRANVIAMSK